MKRIIKIDVSGSCCTQKSWLDCYAEFQRLIDKFWRFGEGRISKEVEKLYKHGRCTSDRQAYEEAWRRWVDGN